MGRQLSLPLTEAASSLNYLPAGAEFQLGPGREAKRERNEMPKSKRGQDKDIAYAESGHRCRIAFAYQECQKAMSVADEQWAEAYLVAKKQRDETIRLANERWEQALARAERR
jgi:hypothetical protein